MQSAYVLQSPHDVVQALNRVHLEDLLSYALRRPTRLFGCRLRFPDPPYGECKSDYGDEKREQARDIAELIALYEI